MKKILTVVLAVVLLLAVSAPVYAADLNPSVELKAAPVIAEEEVPIVDAEGNTVEAIKAEEITITAVTEGEKLEGEAAEKLEKAYGELKEQDLTKVCVNFADVLKTAAPAAKAENFVVRDVFNLAVTEEAAKKLEDAGAALKLKFDLGLKKDAKLIVMVYTENGWEAVDPELVEINEDGSVSVAFKTFGPVAFAVEKA